MAFRNTDEEYGSTAKFFHWFTASLIVVLLLVGWFMGNTNPQIKGTVYNAHKLFGLSVLFLSFIRLGWALSGVKPKLPAAMRPWERVVERIVHGGIYLSLFAMPLCGWAMSTAAGHTPKLFDMSLAMPGISPSKELAQLCGQLHLYLAWTIVLLVSLHAGAALKHHFINKDNVLMTMMPRKKC